MLYKYRKFIVVGLILVVLGIAWAVYYSLFIFHITSTTPNSGSVSRYAPVLRVHFNNISSLKLMNIEKLKTIF